MDIDALKDEAARLIFQRFDEDAALELGIALVELAWADALPVVVDIRTANRTLFHAALPGS
ncbi:MAG: heme-degrading domain-containing protein, partial [Paracoccaceae bacterium]